MGGVGSAVALAAAAGTPVFRTQERKWEGSPVEETADITGGKSIRYRTAIMERPRWP
jgi:hypothetical protein